MSQENCSVMKSFFTPALKLAVGTLPKIADNVEMHEGDDPEVEIGGDQEEAAEYGRILKVPDAIIPVSNFKRYTLEDVDEITDIITGKAEMQQEATA